MSKFFIALFTKSSTLPTNFLPFLDSIIAFDPSICTRCQWAEVVCHLKRYIRCCTRSTQFAFVNGLKVPYFRSCDVALRFHRATPLRLLMGIKVKEVMASNALEIVSFRVMRTNGSILRIDLFRYFIL